MSGADALNRNPGSKITITPYPKMSDSNTIDESLSAKITIKYPNGKAVEFGHELTPSDVKDEPEVQWEAKPDKYYTLIMYDPDVPSRQDPNMANIQHWLVVNILGSDVSSGEVIAEYIGSGPRQGSGLHRYIFLVYEQKKKTVFDEPKSAKNSVAKRRKWSITDFTHKYDLGKAHAGNYYVAQWEPYVEEFRKQFIDL